MTAIALTIAGSDSSGGAGIQADLKTFAVLGVYGASVITALTAQNTQGVGGIFDVPPEFIAAQIDAVFSDLDIAAVKIQHQNRAVGIRDALDHLEHFLHLRRVADDLAELIFLLELFAQVGGLAHGRVVRKGALHAQLQLIHLEGFLQVIEGAVLHGLDRRFDRAKPGNDDDHRGGRERARFLHHLQAVRACLVKVKVRDNQVRRMRRQGCDCSPAIREREHLVPFLPKQLGDHLYHGQVVIHQ